MFGLALRDNPGPIYFQGNLGSFSWSSWSDFFFLLESCLQLEVITNMVMKHLISINKWNFTGIPIIGNTREQFQFQDWA